ncbi:hypothetical protein B8281_10220 [Cellulosimicrobium sp. TH-20]|nr:hypothetical protein B8281_10220 [Cellulosimicrobium sp. TH-20]
MAACAERIQGVRDEHLFGIRLHPVAARTDLDPGAREIGVVHDGELLVVEHEDGSTWVRDVATGDSSPSTATARRPRGSWRRSRST